MMASMSRAVPAFLALGLALQCLVPSAEAFQPHRRVASRDLQRVARRFSAPEKDPEKVVTQNTARDLLFDKRTGRFFEKNLEEECREEFCLTDDTTGKPIALTMEEKERIFLDTLQSYYYDGVEDRLSNEQFDLLKQDLAWEGSQVAMLNRKEALFMNAFNAYLRGEPIISDSEFDELKKGLLEEGSAIAVMTDPQCYIEGDVCKVTWLPDNYKNVILFLPAAGVTIFAWLGLSWQFITPLRSINPLLDLALGAPIVIWLTKKITGLLVQDPLIAKGPCPMCNAENTIFFGDVLGVDGFTGTADLKCTNCKEELKIIRSTLRVSTLPKSAVPSGSKKAAPEKAKA